MSKNASILSYLSTPKIVKPCTETKLSQQHDGAFHELDNQGEPAAKRRLPSRNVAGPLEPDIPFTTVSTAIQPSSALGSSRVIEDSEASDSDSSESSLESLDNILARSRATKGKLTMAPKQPGTPKKQNPSRELKKLVISPAPTKYKFDLKTLSKNAEDYAATNARIERIDALREQQDKENARFQASQEQLLLGNMASEHDDVDKAKVIRAVRRTEAIKTNQWWQFFETVQQDQNIDDGDAVRVEVDTFPKQKMPEPFSRMRDTVSRDSIVVSGFIKDAVDLGCSLPDDVLLWVLHQSYSHSKADLRRAYSDILLASSDQVRRLLTSQHIDEMFRNVGASPSALDLEARLTLRSVENRSYGRRDWSRVCGTIELLGCLSDHASMEFNSHALLVLVRICADTVVLQRKAILCALGSAIIRLRCCFSGVDWLLQCYRICKMVHNSVERATLNLQILTCIPSSEPSLHDLRRRLALCSLFDYETITAQTAHEKLDMWAILKLLDGPQFRITESTDYEELTALISILDIAIDDGICSLSDMADATVEREFNLDIDGLVAKIKKIHNSIHDTGANHLSRIDAKEVLDGVYNRLAFSVRTKPKARKGVFDQAHLDAALQKVEDEAAQTKRQSDFMQRMFQKEAVGRQEAIKSE